jgi:schlafen family protein
VTGLLSPAARRSYYANTLAAFCAADRDVIFAQMARQNDFDLTGTQRHAWLEQAAILQTVLAPYTGSIYLEFTIPRMGRRIDRASTGTRIGPWSFAWWGEGRKLNTGEAGISEWLAALDRSFPAWKIDASDRLMDSEYGGGRVVEALRDREHVSFKSELHLATSMRSFRSERVSSLVKEVLDLEMASARQSLSQVQANYPIALTRELQTARRWLRDKARGSERYGIVVSSQAERLAGSTGHSAVTVGSGFAPPRGSAI